MMQVNEQSVQASARLCDAIKWHPCLYDSKSKVYQMKHAVDAAWRSIANECEDTVTNCKFRWRIIRKSFALSVRKYGSKNKHYLQEYLEFLVPHVPSIEIADDSVNMTGDTGVIEIDEEGMFVEDDDVAEDDDDEDGEHDEAEEDDDENEANDEDEENNAHDESEGNDDSDTTTAEETLRDKTAEKLNRPRKAKANVDSPYVDEEGDEPLTGSQTDEGPRQGRRIIRQRKAPKRYLDTDMYGRNLEKQDEKRARRSTERKKSSTLEESDKRKSTTTFPNKRVEVKLVKTKLSEPTTVAAEPKKLKSVEPEKLKPAVSSDKIRFTFVKPDKTPTNSDVNALPIKTDVSTAVVEMSKKPVNRGTQCDNDVPKTMDEEFLDTIKPQMDLMNSRQKFNFKKRVYQALMDVFDDGTNFPNKDEIVELPPTGAPRFDTTTVGELRLMRELVHLVQAAKSTPEIMDATDKVVTSLDSSPSPTPPPPTAAAITEKSSSVVTASERKSNSPSVGNPKRSETLGLPRHILQKVVKVAGSNGGTILAHEGEKRRVYRIYPKGTLPPSVTNSSGPGSATIGTFYVTPPKSTIAASTQSKTATSSSGNAVTGKPIMFNGKVVNHLSTSNTTPSSSVNANSNNTVTRHKITVRTQTPSGIITQRRLSQSGSANSGSAGTLLLQNKNVTSTNPLSKVTPTTIRTVQRVAWDETPKSSGLSQIQISQPISLNSSANIKTNVKTFLESGTENDSPGETSPNTILPDGGEEEDTPGTNTRNGYDPLFIKTVIKNEPVE